MACEAFAAAPSTYLRNYCKRRQDFRHSTATLQISIRILPTETGINLDYFYFLTQILRGRHADPGVQEQQGPGRAVPVRPADEALLEPVERR